MPGVQGCSLRKSDRRSKFLSICNFIEHAQRVAKLLLQSFRRKGATLSVHTRLRCNSIEKASASKGGRKEPRHEGRRTFNLFTNKNLSCNRVETRFSPGEEEKISWQLQLLGHPKNIHLRNVWRSQDPNQGDYATWPLEMSFEEIQKYEETPTMSGKGLPIVLKLDNEHEQTERDWEGYEELLAAEQERAQRRQLRPYSI